MLILTTLSQALTPYFSRRKFNQREREREIESKEAMFAAENGLKSDPRLQGISEAIRVVPHFPKQGLNSSLVFCFLFFFFLFLFGCLTFVVVVVVVV